MMLNSGQFPNHVPMLPGHPAAAARAGHQHYLQGPGAMYGLGQPGLISNPGPPQAC